MAIRQPTPLQAVSSVILSMSLLALCNGLIHTFVPLRLNHEGYGGVESGLILTCLTAGGVLACLITGSVVRRVGHIRAFTVFAAMVLLSVLALTISTDLILWGFARLIHGLATTSLFIVAQSWMNDATENAWRGRVSSVFYLIYVLCIGAGYYLAGQVDIDSVQAMTIGATFMALALIPVGLTRLPAPPPPVRVQVDFKAVWRISPVGFLGSVSVGGLTMTLQGFIPIHAAAENMPNADIASLLSLSLLGNLVFQWPMGYISDRTDRRYVMLAAVTIMLTMAIAFSFYGFGALLITVLIVGAWVGANESLYSLSFAHANDRADPSDYVMLSSTMMLGWSLGAVVLPGLTTILTSYLGTGAFVYVFIGGSIAFALFVLMRLFAKSAPKEEAQEPFVALPATAPNTGELAAPSEDENEPK